MEKNLFLFICDQIDLFPKRSLDLGAQFDLLGSPVTGESPFLTACSLILLLLGHTCSAPQRPEDDSGVLQQVSLQDVQVGNTVLRLLVVIGWKCI